MGSRASVCALRVGPRPARAAPSRGAATSRRLARESQHLRERRARFPSPSEPRQGRHCWVPRLGTEHHASAGAHAPACTMSPPPEAQNTQNNPVHMFPGAYAPGYARPPPPGATNTRTRQQNRDDRMTESSPTFHRARAGPRWPVPERELKAARCFPGTCSARIEALAARCASGRRTCGRRASESAATAPAAAS